MKILQIGCGGIGSRLIQHICECIEQEQIDTFTGITIADNDIVEIKQKNYQNFTTDDVGKNKARALAQRFKQFGVVAIEERITKEKQLKGYDLILLCVDNQKARDLVIRYCHKKGIEFLDMRTTGRTFFSMPKLSEPENLKFVDVTDTTEYSCQDQADIKKGWQQRGDRIVAEIGCQQLLNLMRGQNNRIITTVV